MRNPAPLPRLTEGTELIDTHCHLDMDAYSADLEQVIRSAQNHGVRRIISVGIDLPSSQAAIAVSRRFADIFATIGIHPHEAASASAATLRQLAALSAQPKVVGFGEIGLDYCKNYASREVQCQVLTKQLHLAKELNLPIIIHDRDAHEDIVRLLKAAGPFPRGGVMHCFSGDRQFAQQLIDMNFMISIPGVVTFKKAETLQEVARWIPLDHLLVETDGPYLAPIPFRGLRNEPKLVLLTAQKVAELKQISLDQVARATTTNAIRLFRLPGEYRAQ